MKVKKDILNSNIFYESCEIQNQSLLSNTSNIFHSNDKIPQIDGNESLNMSVSGLDRGIDGNGVSLTSGHRKYGPQYKRQGCNGHKISHTVAASECTSLPVITIYNMRSIWSKFDSLLEDFENRSASISILNEIWFDENNVDQMNKVEEVNEMDNISFITNPRRLNKRGGGVAVMSKVDDSEFTVNKLDVNVPKHLECLWVLL